MSSRSGFTTTLRSQIGVQDVYFFSSSFFPVQLSYWAYRQNGYFVISSNKRPIENIHSWAVILIWPIQWHTCGCQYHYYILEKIIPTTFLDSMEIYVWIQLTWHWKIKQKSMLVLNLKYNFLEKKIFLKNILWGELKRIYIVHCPLICSYFTLSKN